MSPVNQLPIVNPENNTLHFSIDATPDFSVTGAVTEKGEPLITIVGKVLGTIAAKLVDLICPRLTTVGGKVMLDLRKCNFFSSVALGFIYILATQRMENEGDLILIGANAQICKMIKMMGIEECFIFIDNPEDAANLA